MSNNNNDITKICHISDFHLPVEGKVPFYKLASKRALGLANLKLNRGRSHRLDYFQSILSKMKEESPDVTVATGDMVNLALGQEFEFIDKLLGSSGFTSSNLLMVPGNHDRYTPGAHYRKDFETFFKQWTGNFESREECLPFPYKKKIGNISIIGIDTSIWRGPVRAAGVIKKRTIKQVVDLIDLSAPNEHPVVLMHHPPFKLEKHPLKQYLDGLDGYEKFVKAISGRKITILHGHIHTRSYKKIGDANVIGVPSTSNSTSNDLRRGAYHVLKFDQEGLIEAKAVRPLVSNEKQFEEINIFKR